MKRIIYVLALVVFLVKASFSAAYEWKKDGERLTYDVNWSFLNVGQAELLFRTNADNYKIIGRAWTGKSVNAVYHLLDRILIQGQLQNGGLLTESYTAFLNENNYKAHKTVLYDRSQGKGYYKNIHGGLAPVAYPIEEDSRDLMTALYHLRSLEKELKIGDVYKLPIFELDSLYEMQMHVREKRRMKTVLGKIDLFRIQPVMVGLGDANKRVKDRLSIWVTADKRFIPVKIEIDLPVGSFHAMLTRYGAADSVSEAPEYLPEKGKIDTDKGKNTTHVNFITD
tara:strand:- start:96669 stop:97514 length:846 start_codon:yes stop_codon:yes gene_type:complete